MAFAARGWEGVRWGWVHRGAVLIQGLLCEELEVACAAVDRLNGSWALGGDRCGGRVRKRVVLVHGGWSKQDDAGFAAGGSPVNCLGSGARWPGGQRR